jgi:hypothetical protein
MCTRKVNKRHWFPQVVWVWKANFWVPFSRLSSTLHRLTIQAPEDDEDDAEYVLARARRYVQLGELDRAARAT